MKRVLPLVVLLFLSACKGEKGAKGDPGAKGSPGPSPIIPDNQPEILQYTGLIGSGQVFLSPALQTNSVVLVYLESATLPDQFILLSFDINNVGPWAEVYVPLSVVNFHNCNSTSRYKILVIQPQ